MRKHWLAFLRLFRRKKQRTVWLEYFVQSKTETGTGWRWRSGARIIKVDVFTNECNEELFYEFQKKDVGCNILNGVYSRRTATQLLDGYERATYSE